jgi:hypothetical protein
MAVSERLSRPKESEVGVEFKKMWVLGCLGVLKAMDVSTHNAGVARLVELGLARNYLFGGREYFSKQECREMVRAAGYHDAGKLAIPSEDYYARSLDARQRQLFKMHPALTLMRAKQQKISLSETEKLICINHHPDGHKYGRDFKLGLADWQPKTEREQLMIEGVVYADILRAINESRLHYRQEPAQPELMEKLIKAEGAKFSPAVDFEGIDHQAMISLALSLKEGGGFLVNGVVNLLATKVMDYADQEWQIDSGFSGARVPA